MEDIKKKLDKLDERLDSIDQHLAVYNQQLTDHIRRTEILEQQVFPIKQHVDEIKGAGKLIALLALISTIVAALLTLR